MGASPTHSVPRLPSIAHAASPGERELQANAGQSEPLQVLRRLETLFNIFMVASPKNPGTHLQSEMEDDPITV
jgi:hypothetical protein